MRPALAAPPSTPRLRVQRSAERPGGGRAVPGPALRSLPVRRDWRDDEGGVPAQDCDCCRWPFCSCSSRSPSKNGLEFAAHVRPRDWTEIARVPAPRIVEAEQPDLIRADPVLSPPHVPQRMPGAVVFRHGAPRITDAIQRNPTAFHLNRIAWNRADDLADRLGVAGARTRPQIAA